MDDHITELEALEQPSSTGAEILRESIWKYKKEPWQDKLVTWDSVSERKTESKLFPLEYRGRTKTWKLKRPLPTNYFQLLPREIVNYILEFVR